MGREPTEAGRATRERSDPMHMSTVHSLHASFCFLVNTPVHECAQFYVRERMCTYVELVVLICLRGLVRAFTRACVCMEGSVCVCAEGGGTSWGQVIYMR